MRRRSKKILTIAMAALFCGGVALAEVSKEVLDSVTALINRNLKKMITGHLWLSKTVRSIDVITFVLTRDPGKSGKIT